jgi:predicted nucleotidyltransferase component of viral defense system
MATTTCWSISRWIPHPNTQPPPASSALLSHPRELAGRKVIALFDRAEARDFADVFELIQHFSKEDLLAEAYEVDRGFDRHIFAQMLRSLARFNDADLPAPEAHIASVRDFFATWADELDT